MGVSTDAYLFFGFDFYDPEREQKAPAYDLSEWEEEYARRCGITDGSGLFDDEGEYAFEKGTPEFEAADKAYEVYGRAVQRAVEGAGCVIDTHRSGDVPVYFVAHKNHLIQASRGHPIEIPESRLKAQDHEIQAIIAFCKRMDIPYQDPRWILASWWG